MTAEASWHFHYLHDHMGFVHDETGRVRADRITQEDAEEWIGLKQMADLDSLLFRRWLDQRDAQQLEADLRTPEQR